MIAALVQLKSINHMTGELEAVGNLTSVSTSSVITLTWQPPFSLNLTTAEPDIIYCIDIVNITNEDIEIDHLISNCSVFETYYNLVVVGLTRGAS